MTDIRFADPWVLALLPVVLVLGEVYRRRAGRPRGGIVLSTLAPLAGIRPGIRQWLRRVLPALRLAALALLVVALARPRTVEADAKVSTEGIDIVIALDISGSMAEPGLGAATKLEGAKQALSQFLDSRRDDRVGFVVFKSESRVMSPLTTDYQALKQQVQLADKQNAQLAEGTAIGDGVATALNLLRDSHAKSRIIILATDGENNQHTVEPEQAAAIAKTLNVRLYTIGIPTANARAADTLDEKQMRQISEDTGGSYTRAADARALTDTYNGIATLEKSRIEHQGFTRYNELAPWLLVPAFALVVVETLLGATVFRRAP